MHEDDARMLRELLAWAEQNEDRVEALAWPKVFARWLKESRPLSDKQRKWLRSAYESAFDAPQYENAWSAGKVLRGEHLATPVPDVLRQPLPKSPPGRAS